jgi:flavin-dependent dehydrogenase
VIIGAGVVGLAIGARLAREAYTCTGFNTLVIEKNGDIGEETSSIEIVKSYMQDCTTQQIAKSNCFAYKDIKYCIHSVKNTKYHTNVLESGL